MATVDANAIFVEPLAGTGLAILVTAIICGAISAVVVALRTYVRLREKVFGWDDGLMLGGMLMFVIEVVLACNGAKSGLGAPDSVLNDYMQIKSKEYLMIWMMLYVTSLVLIKVSICVTMFRIGSTLPILRISTFVLLGFSVATYIATIVGILSLCQPISANWNTALVAEGKATCATVDAMIGLSYMSTASSIATDIACAVLPGLIVWNTQLPKKTKLSVCVLLSFGSIASVTTMIRTPYIRFYLNPTDNLIYHVGNIVLWSNIETTIGLVAGSLPSLRRLVMRRAAKASSDQSGAFGSNLKRSSTFGLTTFGGTPAPGRKANRSFKNPTDVGVSVTTINTRGDGDWRRLQDESYDRNEKGDRIRADYTFDVELSRASAKSPVF